MPDVQGMARKTDGSLDIAMDGSLTPDGGIIGWRKSGTRMLIAVAPASLPATTNRRGGFAFNVNGALFVDESTPAANSIRGGIAFRADGAMHVTQAVPDNPAKYVHTEFGSLLVNTSGQVHVTGVYLFDLPLLKSIVPTSANGSTTPTFTRATTAYQQDFEGKQNLVLSGEARLHGARRVQNILSTSLPDGWLTTANMTATTGVSDPDNGTTAVTFTATAPGGYRVDELNLASGVKVIESIFIRRRTGTGTILMYDGSDTDGTTDITSLVTTSWKRITPGVKTAAGGGFNAIGINLADDGDEVDVWHPMQEIVTGQTNQNPSEYVSVGVASAPYHGAGVDGVKYFNTLNGNTVASNVVTEATGTAIVTGASGVAATAPVDAGGPFGYLAEGQRADVLGTTAAIRRVMTDVGWVVGATMTVGAATGADGVASAGASLTGGAVTATNTILFTTVLGSAARTFAALVRRKTGAGTIEMTDNGGTNWTDITASLNSSTYVQVQVTRTQANPIIGFRITTDLDAIEVDFNTIEAGAKASSPPPVNVTRNADIDQYVSSGNLNATAMMVAMDWTPDSAASMGTVFLFGTYVDASNYTAILHDGTNVIARKRIAGVSTDATKALAYAANTKYRIVARFDGTNGIDVWVAGSKGTGDATTTASEIGTNFQIGADGNSANQAFGAIRNFITMQVGLTDAQAASL